jgi:hypothetical protein
MKRTVVPPNEDAQMTHSRRAPTSPALSSEPHDQVIRRWRDLREMLIRQLDLFESGGLTLHANNENVSASAIADLKTSILEFDALISDDARLSAPRSA